MQKTYEQNENVIQNYPFSHEEIHQDWRVGQVAFYEKDFLKALTGSASTVDIKIAPREELHGASEVLIGPFIAYIQPFDAISNMVTRKIQDALNQFGDLVAFDPYLEDGHFYIKKTGDLLLWVYDHITAGWTDDEIVELLSGLEPDDVKRIRKFIEALI